MIVRRQLAGSPGPEHGGASACAGPPPYQGSAVRAGQGDQAFGPGAARLHTGASEHHPADGLDDLPLRMPGFEFTTKELEGHDRGLPGLHQQDAGGHGC